jgi:hypothetical protein
VATDPWGTFVVEDQSSDPWASFVEPEKSPVPAPKEDGVLKRAVKMVAGAPGGVLPQVLRAAYAGGASLVNDSKFSDEMEKIATDFDNLSKDPEERKRQISEGMAQEMIGMGAGMTRGLKVPGFGNGLIGPRAPNSLDNAAAKLYRTATTYARRGTGADAGDVGMLRDQFRTLPRAGATILEMNRPTGEPVMATGTHPEKALSNIQEIKAVHGPAKSAIAKEADVALPEGLDINALVDRLEGVAGSGNTKVERVLNRSAAVKKVEELIQRFRDEHPDQKVLAVTKEGQSAEVGSVPTTVMESPRKPVDVYSLKPGGSAESVSTTRTGGDSYPGGPIPESIVSPVGDRLQPGTTRPAPNSGYGVVLSDKPKISVSDANAFQEWLDNHVYLTGKGKQLSPEDITKDPELRLLRDIGHVFRTASKDAVEKALGPDKAKAYRDSLQQFGDAATFEPVLEKNANRADASPGAGESSRDYRFLMYGGAGAGLGGMVGGPLGVLAGGALGMGADAAAKMVGRYGPTAASRVLRKASRGAQSMAEPPTGITPDVLKYLSARGGVDQTDLNALVEEMLRQKERP